MAVGSHLLSGGMEAAEESEKALLTPEGFGSSPEHPAEEQNPS